MHNTVKKEWKNPEVKKYSRDNIKILTGVKLSAEGATTQGSL